MKEKQTIKKILLTIALFITISPIVVHAANVPIRLTPIGTVDGRTSNRIEILDDETTTWVNAWCTDKGYPYPPADGHGAQCGENKDGGIACFALSTAKKYGYTGNGSNLGTWWNEDYYKEVQIAIWNHTISLTDKSCYWTGENCSNNDVFELSISDPTLSLDSTRNFYVSNAIDVNIKAGASHTPTLLGTFPEGTTIEDGDGNNVTGISTTATQLYVKVPAASVTTPIEELITIGIKSVYTYNDTCIEYQPQAKGCRYDNQSDVTLYQGMIMYWGVREREKEVTGDLEEEVVVNIVATENAEIKVSKQDITSKEELPGAKMNLNCNNDFVAEFTSTDMPTVYYLEKGISCTLIETIAPEGYQEFNTEIKFNIDDDGNIILVSPASDYYRIENGLLIVFNGYEPTVIETPNTGSYIWIGAVVGGIVLITAGYFFLKKKKVA